MSYRVNVGVASLLHNNHHTNHLKPPSVKAVLTGRVPIDKQLILIAADVLWFSRHTNSLNDIVCTN